MQKHRAPLILDAEPSGSRRDAETHINTGWS
jgi:hypothetical protein